MKKFDKVNLLRLLLSIGISLAVVFIIILFVSENPIESIWSFCVGPLSSLRRAGNIIELMIPLMFSSLATIFLFRTGLFNLSAEGAFFAGAVMATVVSLKFDNMPIVGVVVSVVAASIVGGIVTSLPGILKIKANANVIVTSLMTNFICLNIGLFIIHSYYLDDSLNTPYSYKFGSNFKLPGIIQGTRVHVGLIIAILVVILSEILLNKSRFGIKCRLIGANSKMADYAGLNSSKVILLTQAIGGVLAGMGGSIELFGMYNRFQYNGLTNHGWEGIPIAIIAGNNPKFVPLAALFFAYLKIGADIMSRETDVPFEIIQIIQAVMIVFISAQALLSGYRRKVMLSSLAEQQEET